MENESAELMEYLGQIAKRSIEGEIPWSQPNPSMFTWIQAKDSGDFQVTIQKATNPKRLSSGLINALQEENTYLFQVQDRRKGHTAISLSSAERPELQSVLGGIFRGAEKGKDIRSSQVLKMLLE